LSYDGRNADLLFQVVSRRYEKRSIVLTTNLAFRDWGHDLPTAACTLIDRLVHRADIIAIGGESYRKREAKKRATRETHRSLPRTNDHQPAEASAPHADRR
jgi:DNA replication protein DnaC